MNQLPPTQFQPGFSPQQVNLHTGTLPLVGTLGRAELESAASLIVLACQATGEWHACIWSEVAEAIKADDRFMKLSRNPFWFPDMDGIVRRGFAYEYGVEEQRAIGLTESGFAALKGYVCSESQKSSNV